MSPSARPQTVEAYINGLEQPKADTMRAIIANVLGQHPGLQAVIAWNVPQIKFGHAYVFGLCAYKSHLTLSPWSERIIAAFRPRLGAYVVRKHCFLVPIDWRPDSRLLGDLVVGRLAELANPSPPPEARRRWRKA